MKPGRELDALVAEKVMGLPPFAKAILPKLGRHIIADNSGASCLVCGRDVRDDDLCLPRYSTDIASAWKVIEKIHSSEFNWSSGVGFWDGNQSNTKLKISLSFKCEDDYKAWSIRLYDEQNNTLHMATVGDSAPHIICLAALKAVGVEV